MAKKALALPAGLTLRGGAADSGRELLGHGLWWNGDHLAALAASGAGVPIVKNHDEGIEAIAGVITSATADRHDVELPTYTWTKDKDGGMPVRSAESTGVTVEHATNLKFVGHMDETHQGYKAVARHITGIRAKGAVPHVSASIMGQKYRYDAATDRLILDGPYKWIHQGVVAYGASQPDGGVGVFACEPLEMEAEPGEDAAVSASLLASHMTGKFQVSASVELVNADDLWIDFAEERGYDDPIVLRAAVALGIDAEAAPKKKATKAATPPASPAPASSQGDTGDGVPRVEAGPSYPPGQPQVAGTSQGAKMNMPDNPPPPSNPVGAGVPPEIQAKLDAMEAKLASIGAVEAKLAEIEKREAALENSRLDTRRAELANATGLPVATFAGHTAAALDMAEKVMASGNASQMVSIRNALAASAPDPESTREKDRKAFLASLGHEVI